MMIKNKTLGVSKLIFIGIFAFVFLFLIQSVAAICSLDANLINQDPYPALPGDYVEVVFQLSGVDDTDCKGAVFEIIPEYPFSLDETESAKRILDGPTYMGIYKKTWMILYKLRVDENAIEGKNEMEIRYNSGASDEETYFFEKFNISVENLIGDFEVYVKDYDKKTNELTFEILNTGEHDVEALTVDIPVQENIIIKGSHRNIIGSLDSNEETVFNFEATPKKGEINLKITYTDTINERRLINKAVFFEPEYFEGRADGEGYSLSFYLLIGLMVLIILVFVIKRIKKKR